MSNSMRTLGLILSGTLIGLIGGRFFGVVPSSPPPPSIPQSRPETAVANGAVLLAPGVTAVDALTLRAETNLYNGHPARNADGTVNVIVEIPAGTNAKWEVVPAGTMNLEVRNGSPRVVQYLPYVGNYGMIPSTKLPKELGGDGDALDVLILGPALPRGTVAAVRVIGVMKCLDGGEQDDKVLAVMADTPLGNVRSLKDLNESFPDVSVIVQKWFLGYKGPGKMEFKGWGEVAEAEALVDQAAAAAKKS